MLGELYVHGECGNKRWRWFILRLGVLVEDGVTLVFDVPAHVRCFADGEITVGLPASAGFRSTGYEDSYVDTIRARSVRCVPKRKAIMLQRAVSVWALPRSRISNENTNPLSLYLHVKQARRCPKILCARCTLAHSAVHTPSRQRVRPIDR